MEPLVVAIHRTLWYLVAQKMRRRLQGEAYVLVDKLSVLGN